MEQIEVLRATLHKAIDNGNYEEILSVSRELDKLIYCYMSQMNFIKTKSA